MLTERQSSILDTIIEEHIKTAVPISSSAVFDIGDFNVSCPTIRNEMADLTELGYLTQPHTSAGRVPTERGYRFFVDNLLAYFPEGHYKKSHTEREGRLRIIAQEISVRSSDLVVFMDEDGSLQHIGLKKVFNKPEFESRNTVISFVGELERLDHSIDEILASIDEEIDVFIGSENPFFERDDYSIVFSRFDDGFISIIGPMRMNYRRNLQLL